MAHTDGRSQSYVGHNTAYYQFLRSPEFSDIARALDTDYAKRAKAGDFSKNGFSLLESLAETSRIATARSALEEVPVKIARDARALSPVAGEQDYLALETRLVGYVNENIRRDAVRSKELNRNGTVYSDAIDYLTFLNRHFDLDETKVGRIVFEVMKAFIAKAPYAHAFAPEGGFGEKDAPLPDLWKAAFLAARPPTHTFGSLHQL